MCKISSLSLSLFLEMIVFYSNWKFSYCWSPWILVRLSSPSDMGHLNSFLNLILETESLFLDPLPSEHSSKPHNSLRWRTVGNLAYF